MPAVSTGRGVEQPALPEASQIKAVIREALAQGASAAEIKAELASRFGPEVLSIPAAKRRRILAVGLLVGVGGVGLVLWARRRRRLDEVRYEGYPDEHGATGIESDLTGHELPLVAPGPRADGQPESGLANDPGVLPPGDDEA